MPNSKEVKILSITSNSKQVYGLGSDNKVYKWSYYAHPKGRWVLVEENSDY
jgi:hypothetical protein